MPPCKAFALASIVYVPATGVSMVTCSMLFNVSVLRLGADRIASLFGLLFNTHGSHCVLSGDLTIRFKSFTKAFGVFTDAAGSAHTSVIFNKAAFSGTTI